MPAAGLRPPASGSDAYVHLLERLVSARRFGMKLGLERMRELLDKLGAPDRQLGTVVHIGGTNGKGSTVAMFAALARSAGKRVATYTSPHLSTLRERITIDGELASEHDVVEAAQRVSAAGGDELTFFEQVTAIAMVLIATRRIDITVLEVGLGGRLDATNVVDAPIAAVTGVAFDHEAILGDTLSAIAFEKAGIFKPGQRAFIGAAGEPDAVPLLAQHARDAGVAALHVIDEAALLAAHAVPLGLPGAHQQRNAALALAISDALALAADRSVLATLHHPGRFEIIDDVILDGAHNPHGARALAATLRERGLKPVLVIAVSADKDVRAIATALAPEVRGVIATRYQQERALAPEDLASVFRDLTTGDARALDRDALNADEIHADEIHADEIHADEIHADEIHADEIHADDIHADDIHADDIRARDTRPGDMTIEVAADLYTALARARTFGSPILIAGSLFLVGEARTLLVGAPTDPVFVTDPTSTRA